MHFKVVIAVKCIFKGLVGLCTLSSSLQNSHDTSHVEISLHRDFYPTMFLNTILSTAEISYKNYK